LSYSKIVIIGAIILFGTIGAISFFKSKPNKEIVFDTKKNKVQEVKIFNKNEPKELPKKDVAKEVKKEDKNIAQNTTENEKIEIVKKENLTNDSKQISDSDNQLPDADIIDRLFALDSTKLPIVETINYTSRVPWLKGRNAWIADYAAHYSTTRHFIARSLNRKPDYFTQKIGFGDRFNVLKAEKNISFHLLIDINRSKLWFYYLDNDANERTLLKTYKVGLGRKESNRASGSLTPVGKYLLGSKVAIYRPNTMGYFQDKKIEMIKVFGTRWIPFDKEVENCSESSKGLGLHGAPWKEGLNQDIVEDRSKIGKYESDGCIRLFSEDIEEIFSIIISRPTVVEIVKDFHDAKLPGIEKKY